MTEKLILRAFRLDPATDRKLKALARRYGGNVSEVLRSLIDAAAARAA